MSTETTDHVLNDAPAATPDGAGAGPLPADAFWEAAGPLDPPPPLGTDVPPALERLGPSPFPKSGFPFLGFLATVYDHVATQFGSPEAAPGPDGDGGAPPSST